MTLEELKSFYFLYIWTPAFAALLEISFHDFFVPFSPSSYFFFFFFSFILLVYLGCVLAFNDIFNSL
jgi:hypothetical protein